VAQYTDHEWEKAIEQISDINQQTIGKHFNCTDFNVFKIVLMIMPACLVQYFYGVDLYFNACLY